MRGYQLYKRWQSLLRFQQDYAVGFLTGLLAMEEEGFTDERPHKEHATYALDEFYKALGAAEQLSIPDE